MGLRIWVGERTEIGSDDMHEFCAGRGGRNEGLSRSGRVGREVCGRARRTAAWYADEMNKELVELLERVKEWPADRQEDVVHVLEGMEESGTKTYRTSKGEREAILEGLESELVSDDAVETFRRRHHA